MPPDSIHYASMDCLRKCHEPDPPASDATHPHMPSAIPQRQLHAATAVVQMPFVNLAPCRLQRGVLVILSRSPGSVVRCAGQVQQRTLPSDRKSRGRIDHRLPFGSSRGDSFSCRKSRSIVSSPILRCSASESTDESVDVRPTTTFENRRTLLQQLLLRLLNLGCLNLKP